MPGRSADPLVGVDLLVVDGTNLLHALRRRSGSSSNRGAPTDGGPLPATALIGRLRGAIPAAVRIELVLDGPPERGLRNVRIASGLTVRHAAPLSADAAIANLAGRLDAASVAGLLVVSDDRELRQAVGARGARTAGAAWLLGRLARARLSAPSVGNRRPAFTPSDGGDGADEGRWQPGRGATTKHGNANRSRRSRRPG